MPETTLEMAVEDGCSNHNYYVMLDFEDTAQPISDINLALAKAKKNFDCETTVREAVNHLLYRKWQREDESKINLELNYALMQEYLVVAVKINENYAALENGVFKYARPKLLVDKGCLRFLKETSQTILENSADEVEFGHHEIIMIKYLK